MIQLPDSFKAAVNNPYFSLFLKKKMAEVGDDLTSVGTWFQLCADK